MKMKKDKVNSSKLYTTYFNVYNNESGLTRCKIYFNTTKSFYNGLEKSGSICLDEEESFLLYKKLKKHFKSLKKKNEKVSK